jgi:hypothetical protein
MIFYLLRYQHDPPMMMTWQPWLLFMCVPLGREHHPFTVIGEKMRDEVMYDVVNIVMMGGYVGTAELAIQAQHGG